MAFLVGFSLLLADGGFSHRGRKTTTYSLLPTPYHLLPHFGVGVGLGVTKADGAGFSPGRRARLIFISL
jgi:hypothetical protein